MKYLICFLVLMMFISTLHSYTIEETLQEIKSLEKEIAQNEKIVEQKIEELKKNDPLFAEQNQFETLKDYDKRLLDVHNKINTIRSFHLDNLMLKMRLLKNRIFETKKISINLGKYDI